MDTEAIIDLLIKETNKTFNILKEYGLPQGLNLPDLKHNSCSFSIRGFEDPRFDSISICHPLSSSQLCPKIIEIFIFLKGRIVFVKEFGYSDSKKINSIKDLISEIIRLESISLRGLRKKRAAKIIQKAFRKYRYNPKFPFCKRVQINNLKKIKK